MKRKVFLPLLFLSVAHFLICALSGGLGWPLQMIIVSVTSILALWFAISKRHASGWAGVAVILPFYLLYSILSCLIGTMETYPIWIYGLLVSGLTLLLLRVKAPAGFSIGLLVLMVFIGGKLVWPNWIGRITSEPNPELYQPFRSGLVDVHEQPLDTASLRGKVVVFDIWHSACYYCIKQFPEIEALYDQYRDDTTVRIISLNFPLAKDKGVRPTHFTDPYHFEKAYFKSEDEYAKFSARSLPLLLIMDKNMQCRYAGQLHTGWNIFIGNAKRIIKQLKNED